MIVKGLFLKKINIFTHSLFICLCKYHFSLDTFWMHFVHICVCLYMRGSKHTTHKFLIYDSLAWETFQIVYLIANSGHVCKYTRFCAIFLNNNINKSALHSRLRDEHLQSVIWLVNLCDLKSNIESLVTVKHYQKSFSTKSGIKWRQENLTLVVNLTLSKKEKSSFPYLFLFFIYFFFYFCGLNEGEKNL